MFPLINCLPVSLVHTLRPLVYLLPGFHCSSLVPLVNYPVSSRVLPCDLFSLCLLYLFSLNDLPVLSTLPACLPACLPVSLCASTVLKLNLLTMRPPPHVLHSGPTSKPSTMTTNKTEFN
ncbi:hypothetical protein ATANTOWER_030167 [Ataeniobius toweri]|uniref:Uncharacterized protein n=1 Tax=Ataeniobius toweri TaxID=208326 RepID=A0ABU7CJX9_9TELE|nr:hypothetical protein [Ataeniobius toweri]